MSRDLGMTSYFVLQFGAEQPQQVVQIFPLSLVELLGDFAQDLKNEIHGWKISRYCTYSYPIECC